MATVVPAPTTTFTVVGDLDAAGGAQVRAAWDDACDDIGDRVRLDLMRVTSCDAAGLQALGHVAAGCEARGRELEIATQGLVDWLLQLVGMQSARPGPGE